MALWFPKKKFGIWVVHAWFRLNEARWSFWVTFESGFFGSSLGGGTQIRSSLKPNHRSQVKLAQIPNFMNLMWFLVTKMFFFFDLQISEGNMNCLSLIIGTQTLKWCFFEDCLSVFYDMTTIYFTVFTGVSLTLAQYVTTEPKKLDIFM